MKKMKRILALATAAAMTLGMFAMSVAAGDDDSGSTSEENGNSGTTQIVAATVENGVVKQLPIKKVIDLGDQDTSTLPKMAFYFTMTPATVTDGTKDTTEKNSVNSGVALTNNTVHVTFDSNAQADADDTISSTAYVDLTGTDIQALKTGVYRYNVQETIPTASDAKTDADGYNVKVDGMVYDSTVFQVDLYVQQDDDGKGYVSSVVAVKTTDPTSKVPIIFENSLATYSVSISKTVAGDAADDTQAFDFYIQIPEGGDNITLMKDTEIAYSITGTGIEESQTGYFLVEGDPVTSDQTASTVNFPTSNENETESNLVGNFNHFTLKNGQTLTITGLPEGMIFYLAEADYSSDGYATTLTYGFTGTQYNMSATNASTRQIKGTITNGSNTIAFTNTKNLVVETGINVDFAPYVLILMVAIVGGAAVLVFKKRRTVR